VGRSQRNEVAAFGSNQSACSERNDDPSPLVHPFSPEFKKTFSGEKNSMRVREFAAWRIFFHLGMQDHSIEYRNTEQLCSNYSLAQSPEE
jgi:hypothetical protein